MKPTPAIATARLLLRDYRPEDAEALHVPLSDAETMHYWSSAPKTSLDETRAYMDEGRGDNGWRCWIIRRSDENRVLGFVSAGATRAGVSEIGYILAPAAKGQGIAREAVTAVIDHLFAVEGDRRIFADTDPNNAGSNALLERLGFTLEGRLREAWETHIGISDSNIWGLLAKEWAVRSPR